MKIRSILGGLFIAITSLSFSQQSPSIYKISNELLAGEGLDVIPQKDSTRTVYQKKVYDGKDLAVFIVAIGTGITNEFRSFPLEEFIFWMNGKAVVEPVGEDPISVYTGDYFIQAKGFNGKWNFVDIGGVHLELALVAKNRPDSTFKSPMFKALVIDRDIISGVSKPTDHLIYEGPELTVNLLTQSNQLENLTNERMLHVLNGTLTLMEENQTEQTFYPGDFFVVPEGFNGTWTSTSIQNLRVFEVYKTVN